VPPAVPTFVPLELAQGARVNQFELIRELGRGGMGQVFLARDTRLARLVALKFLGLSSEDLTRRFLVEARATARCQHENIVVIYEADEWQGRPYMALEYLEGEPLAKSLESRRLPPSRAIEIVVQVVRALARAHELSIIHCDLKPDNIYVTTEGVVKVLDFGIARLFTGGKDGRAPAPADLAGMGTTEQQGISGTLPYMAPEQWGADAIDRRTDLWAVGIILWEMLTGQHPLGADVTPQRLWKAAATLDEPMPRIASAMPDVPSALEAIIDRCLAKRKEQRFASARELLEALEPLLPGRLGRRLEEGENPYPGMTAFQESDADRFFGRSRDVTHMIARMTDHPLLGVVAPSGVGKSSFIRAGVIPALRASDEAWEVFVTRPGKSPLSSLATLLQPIAHTGAADLRGTMNEHEALLARLRAEPGYLGTLLRSRARQKRERILLFVDQFEELYTLCGDADERRAYTACLAGVADDPATPLRAVVSMRSDFLDRAAEDRVFMERLTRGLLFLPPVDRDGMREALVQPLAMVGCSFEREATVDDMLDSLAGAPGALPLLQFTASMLWDARDRGRRVLSAASYQEIGGVAGALASHADHVLAAMSPDRQKLARAVLLRLVTSDGTRALVDVAELSGLASDPGEVRAVVDQLVHARLLVVQTREEGPVVEIVHESLITRWPTLRRWIEESAEDAAFLEQLRGAAKQWEARGRAAGLLWRGEALEDARTFARRHKGPLAGRERAFLDAVLDLGARAARRRRALVIAAFVVLGGVAAAAAIALLWIREAEQTAQEQRSVAMREMARAQEAEARVNEQMDTIKEQLATIQRKEDERARAESERARAEEQTAAATQELSAAETEVAAKKEDLAEANQRLEKALAVARAAQREAEAAERTAKAAADKLEDLLEKERARVKRLEDEKKKLSTQLK
jgi:serine/threonine protein kinase